MTYKEAIALRNEIHDHGTHCTVPKGCGPDRYVCRILTDHGEVDFASPAEWSDYVAAARKRRTRELRRPQSVLEHLIDKACGVTPNDYEG